MSGRIEIILAVVCALLCLASSSTVAKKKSSDLSLAQKSFIRSIVSNDKIGITLDMSCGSGQYCPSGTRCCQANLDYNWYCCPNCATTCRTPYNANCYGISGYCDGTWNTPMKSFVAFMVLMAIYFVSRT